MPDLRRLRRDRERAPLDVLIALRTETGDYNDSGIWVPGPHTDVVMWARREDPDTETHRTLTMSAMVSAAIPSGPTCCAGIRPSRSTRALST